MKVSLTISLLLTIFLVGCASLNDQMKSRELLAKCQYELKKVELENFNFDKMIEVTNAAKQIDFNNPSINDVKPLLKDIKDLNFNLNFSTLDFALTIGVKNPNPIPIQVDSLVFDAFMDQTKVTNVIHDGPMNIGAQSESELRLIFAMPTSYKLKNLTEAENINLKGRIWLKIELIKGLPFTLPFNFDVKQEIPREQIQQQIDAQKKKVVEKIVKVLAGDKVGDLLKKF